jgi:hypothetical protein
MNFIANLIILGIALFVYLGMKFIVDSISAFAEEANRIERMINDDEDATVIHEAIISLGDKSFHRSTTKRLREICVMFENKYGRFILKD